MVMVEMGGAFTLRLPGKRRSVLPSPLGAVGNPSVGSPIMVCCRSGGPSRAGPMTMAPEPSPMGESLRLLNRSVMNSRFPKQMVLSREKPSHDKCSLPVVMMNADGGTIRASIGKARYKIPLPGTPTVSVFLTGKI
jgi:hypothetical protein